MMEDPGVDDRLVMNRHGDALSICSALAARFTLLLSYRSGGHNA
jgi:hypothetical protein